MSFDTALRSAQDQIAQAIVESLSDIPGFVGDGMRYATGGGKRLRGFLVIESARLFDAHDRALLPAAAIECMHAYSLVHDDLPAMDDDDLRRGQPTVHIKWDEATAILVGDALQTHAFELLTHPPVGTADQRLDLIQSLTKAAGALGMVRGQAEDIAAESADAPLTLEEITTLQAGKTGALIRWSAEAGARLASEDIAHLRRYADALGLAFQIADDILDIEGDAAKAGKRLRKDAAAGKATFVSLLGLDPAKKRAAELVAEAQDALSPYCQHADTLRALARFVIAREQ